MQQINKCIDNTFITQVKSQLSSARSTILSNIDCIQQDLMDIYSWRSLDDTIKSLRITCARVHSSDRIIYFTNKLTLIYAQDDSLVADTIVDEDNAPITYSKQSLLSMLQQQYPYTPHNLPFLLDVKIIACSKYHCLFGTLAAVFSLGQGSYGQLGLGENILSVSTPKLVTLPDGESPRSIAVSDFHSCIVTSPNGLLYTFGCGAFYRLGHGDDHDLFVPRRVDSLMAVGSWLPNGQSLGIEKVSCSIWHTLVLTSGVHDVYSWGWNNFGQCSDIDEDTTFDFDDDRQSKRLKSMHSAELPSHNTTESCNLSIPKSTVQQRKKMIIHPERITSLDVLDEEGHKDKPSCHIVDIACGHRFSAFLTASGDILIM